MPIYMNKGGSSGGGGYSETLLWTNPNPNTAFAAISLTDVNPMNYDYIKVKFKKNTASDAYVYTELLGTSRLTAGVQTYLNVFSYTDSSGIYFREILKDANDALGIEYAWRLVDATQQLTNNQCIPVEVYGVNIS